MICLIELSLMAGIVPRLAGWKNRWSGQRREVAKLRQKCRILAAGDTLRLGIRGSGYCGGWEFADWPGRVREWGGGMVAYD